MMKRKLVNFSIKNWKNNNNGLVVFEESAIIGLINNPVDYVLDGFVFLNRKKMKSMTIVDNELKQRIITSKAQSWLGNFPKLGNTIFQNYQEVFEYLKTEDIFCELSLSKENAVYLGRIIEVHKDSIDIDFYSTDFNLLDSAFVKFNDIRLVTIHSDYSTTFENEIKNNHVSN